MELTPANRHEVTEAYVTKARSLLREEYLPKLARCLEQLSDITNHVAPDEAKKTSKKHATINISSLPGLERLKCQHNLAIFAARLFHQFDEAAEVVRRVVRAGRGFRVVLNGEDGQATMAQALDAIIV